MGSVENTAFVYGEISAFVGEVEMRKVGMGRHRSFEESPLR